MDNCQFIDCSGPICNEGFNTDWNFTDCQFKHLDLTKKIEESEYLTTPEALIIVGTNPYHQDYRSVIINCLFEDINLGDGFIACCNTDKSVSMPGLFIKNCHFKDIHTTRYDKKIIKKSGTFSAFLGEKSVTTVSVSGCTGLENADSGSLSGIVYEPIKIFDDGTTIGAEYTSEDLLNSDVHQKIASGVSGFSKPEKSAVFKNIYSAISDFLEKETCGTPADKFKESDLDKIFSQFDVPSEIQSPTNLLGIYNGTISLKSELAGDFIGILFLKDRFYYKKTVASEITGMLYENIKSVGKTSDYSNSVYIDGENYESVVLKGNLYSSPEITSLFYKIYHEIERLK